MLVWVWDLLFLLGSLWLSTSSSSPQPRYKELLKVRLVPDYPPSVVLSPLSFVWFLLWLPVSGHLPVSPPCFRSAFWSKLTEFHLSVTCGVGVLSISSKPFRSQYSPVRCPTLYLCVADSWIATPVSDPCWFSSFSLSRLPSVWSSICLKPDLLHNWPHLWYCSDGAWSFCTTSLLTVIPTQSRHWCPFYVVIWSFEMLISCSGL